MSQLFAASFDEPVPSSGWSVFSASIVPGRNNNGAQMGGGVFDLGISHPFTSCNSMMLSGALKLNALQGAWALSASGGVTEGCSLFLNQLGDGRMSVELASAGDSIGGITDYPLDLSGEYSYLEWSASIFAFVDASDPSNHLLSVSATGSVYINGLGVLSYSLTNGPIHTLRGGGFQPDFNFALCNLKMASVVDDIVARSGTLGATGAIFIPSFPAPLQDARVNASDVVSTIFPIDVRLTQTVLEPAGPDLPDLRLTQTAFEPVGANLLSIRFTQCVLEVVGLPGGSLVNYAYTRYTHAI